MGYWLVVSIIFSFPFIYGMSSFPLTLTFFKMVKITNQDIGIRPPKVFTGMGMPCATDLIAQGDKPPAPDGATENKDRLKNRRALCHTLS